MELSWWIFNLIVTHEEKGVVGVVEIFNYIVDTWLMGSKNYRTYIIKQIDHKRSKSECLMMFQGFVFVTSCRK